MSDAELFDKIARLWLDSGGDGYGFRMTWTSVAQRIDQLEAGAHE